MEGKGFRDRIREFENKQVAIFGVSFDTVEENRAFAEKFSFPFPLLSDPDRAVIRAYGVLGPGGLVRRSIFMVDPGGRVRYRHAALLGLHYRDVGELRSALQGVRSAPA